jgi:hypothetical protein
MQRHLHKIELLTGAFLVLIGIFVATGRLQSLSQNFANQFAATSTHLENCVIGMTRGEIALGDLVNCINTPQPLEPPSTSANSEIVSVQTSVSIIHPLASSKT